MEDRIECEVNDGILKIFINHKLHLCVSLSEIVCIDSWIHVPTILNRYYIDITFSNNWTRLEYKSRKNWEEVLRLINKYI